MQLDESINVNPNPTPLEILVRQTIGTMGDLTKETNPK